MKIMSQHASAAARYVPSLVSWVRQMTSTYRDADGLSSYSKVMGVASKSGRHHGQAVVSNALVARTSSRFAADFVSKRDSRPGCRYQALLRRRTSRSREG